MMLRVAVVCALLAYVSAQEYACSPPGYCSSQGFDRIDEMGCSYFCYMDVDPPTGLTCPEFHRAYNDWKGSASECDLDCFVAAQQRIIPQACDSEIVAVYNILAEFDGDTSTVSGSDIESWCQYVLVLETSGSNVISPNTWKIFWNILYLEVGDVC